MTHYPYFAAHLSSYRSIGAPSSSYGVKRGAGFGPSASLLHPRLRSRVRAQDPDKRLVNQSWAKVMAQDHALLRLLLERFEQTEQARERAMLLRLGLDFHEMHAVFESAWVQIPALGPARAALDDLAEQIECTALASKLHRARGLSWKSHLIGLMQQEEIYHREKQPRSGAFIDWSEDFLRWRVSLGSEIRSALNAAYSGTVPPPCLAMSQGADFGRSP
jgi:hypothetical protein